MRTAVLKIVQLHVIGIDKECGRPGNGERSGPFHRATQTRPKTNGRGRSCAVPTILQSSRASLWVLGAPSVLLLSRPSQSLPCSDVLPIWKIEPVDLGRFLRPFGAELIHTHPPRQKLLLHGCQPRGAKIFHHARLECRRRRRQRQQRVEESGESSRIARARPAPFPLASLHRRAGCLGSGEPSAGGGTLEETVAVACSIASRRLQQRGRGEGC